MVNYKEIKLPNCYRKFDITNDFLNARAQWTLLTKY